MALLSHLATRLSMPLLGLGLAIGVSGIASAAAPSPYSGRWTVDEAQPTFTARGQLYKSIDMAICGKNFCGVSVDDAGKCGATLFRLPIKQASDTDTLRGKGKWGTSQLNMVAYSWEDEEKPGSRVIDLYLGHGYNFGERSGSMPKFHSMYRRSGQARCIAR